MCRISGSSRTTEIPLRAEDIVRWGLNENRNLVWNKRVKARLILIFSTNTNRESVAYRSFRPLVSALPIIVKQNSPSVIFLGLKHPDGSIKTQKSFHSSLQYACRSVAWPRSYHNKNLGKNVNTWWDYEKSSQHKYTWTISSLELGLASIRLTWTVQSIKTRAHVRISTRTVHGKGQHADMCTDLVHQLSKISTRTVHGKDEHADMCCQRADICTDRQSMDSLWLSKISQGKDQRADMCTDGQPQTFCAKITRTVHGKGQHAESKDQRAAMCTDGQPRTSGVC
ncbi:unnamed protein product [Brassica rapa]|uniref:Uncharacterized protein n=1 Tax=Brassica campestris TaxID=3711 RepID=A0A8D9GCI7_BRACM|nr:unnamed protein product [Brassica rapa]